MIEISSISSREHSVCVKIFVCLLFLVLYLYKLINLFVYDMTMVLTITDVVLN